MKVEIVSQPTVLDAVFALRTKVFVEEQGVPADIEFDGQDSCTEYVLVMADNQPVGTGRMRVVDGAAKLERICVLASHRKYGLGKSIVCALEDIARSKGLSKARLNSQTHAEEFYSKLGYKRASGLFMEAGIAHVLMIKDLGNAAAPPTAAGPICRRPDAGI